MVDQGVDDGRGFGAGVGRAVRGGMMSEVIRGVEREDMLVAFHEKQPLEQAAALIVEEIFVPAAFGEFGNDDNDATIGMLV